MGQLLYFLKQQLDLLAMLLILGVYLSIPVENERIKYLDLRVTDSTRSVGVILIWVCILGIVVKGIAINLVRNSTDNGLVKEFEDDES